ncbi:M3 family metallopeptidase [Bacteroides heparinolyticus]|uniref:M3 family metallopeptidase n=1 Tax=Prevotella heparinolytica TaxID=28113 RepID=UPI00359F6824
MTLSQAQNPFLQKYDTPHGTVPFHLIKNEHYEEAIREGIRQQQAEVDAIIANPETPTFANTIVALEYSGKLLERASGVFFNLQSAETNDEMQQLARKLTPELTKHSNNINLNEALFRRVKTVYENREKAGLNPEQQQLLDKVYKGFTRRGANLSGADRETYRQLSERLSLLTLTFGENNLKEVNEYTLPVTDKALLAGLPESALEAAAETAAEKGMEGWVFTQQAPSYIPLMTYADNRELRRQLYTAYNSKCTRGETSNLDIVKQIANTRLEMAKLLGFKSYAEYTLCERMAKDSPSVYNLLDRLIEAYMPVARQELAEVQDLARSREGEDFTIMPWDWAYYAQKLKDRKYSIDDELLRPYFELSRVKDGVFGLATRLYGITFKKNTDIPVYHKDVDAYEVFDKDGRFLAVLYTDFHPRAGKRSGAWMSEFKGQWKDPNTGEDSRPHIIIVMNFTKPTQEKPALLTFDEVDTFLHEFGHALHGMFAATTYPSMSGTSVYRDFVELPSQIMENFGTEKEFLHTFAKHYQTGELIPDELVQRIIDSANFNVAYACLRQVSFGLLDMAWHNREMPFEGNVKAYEQEAWKKAQLLPVVEDACMSANFGHIFSGGYAAGYYSYKWAEVLDADAFSLFKEKGIFDTSTADSFRANILSKGGTEHPMELYKRFRGQEPTIDALLRRNGIR